MRSSLLLLLLLLGLASCRSSENETVDTTNNDTAEVIPAAVKGEVSTTEKVGRTGRNHGYLKRIYQEQGRTYATIDYIQFLTGAPAVAAAKHRGDAQLTVQNGDSVYAVFNDYYIVNEDTVKRTFPLSEQVTITSWDRTGELRQVSLTPAQLMGKNPELLSAMPFIIETKQGVVVGLTEQYVP